MELSTIARWVSAFYRAVGTEATDTYLVLSGEAQDDVAYTYLTRGIRAAQRFMIGEGRAERWLKRSSAITAASWEGTDAANGGRYIDLPSDCMRISGDFTRSALEEADGTAWGRQVPAEQARRQGNLFYLRGDGSGTEQLWICRSASPPSPLYLLYHYAHPVLSSATASFDFPIAAAPLAIAEAAYLASLEAWYPGDAEKKRDLVEARALARQEATDLARDSRQPREALEPLRYASHW